MGDFPGTPLDFPAGSEQRDNRRTHRGGDMHGSGIDADESARLPRQGGELAQAQRARQIDDARPRLAFARAEDNFDKCALACIRRTRDRDPHAGRGQSIEQRRGVLGWPALEQPA
jgi:hypothetical protein